MKFSWNEILIWLSLISSWICMCAVPISDFTGIDVWSIIYFGIVLISLNVTILIYFMIKKFKSKK